MKKIAFLKRPIIEKAIFVAVIAAFFGAGAILLWLSTLTIPDLSTFDERKVAESTKIYDRTGEVLLYDVHKNIKRTILPYNKISRNIKNATVAIEDDEFWQHKGVKPRAFLRAILVNLQEGSFSQGGSTITQQVIKNALLTTDKTISRKLKEWVLAIKLEQELSKEEILTAYLNEVPYGGSIYGIEEASQAFFGKSAEALTLAESAYLASLPNAPTFYSPYGNNRDKLEDRKNLVLQRMLGKGFITNEEFEAAMKETVVFKEQQDFGIKAPHFVIFIRQYLEETYGKEAVEKEGYRVITTLDYELQQKGEEVVKAFALENGKKFNAENAGLVAIDPKTGQILTMVGSRDYADPEIDGNFNVTLARRQPGSSFKPFAYAAAINKGYTHKTTVFDVKTQFSTACPPNVFETNDVCYTPGNYDEKFRGPITFRNALAQSVNVPAIKVLYLAGVKNTLELARDMGITSLTDPDRYGLTLVLGGGEVSLLEMTSAYSVFANEGKRNSYTGILRIEDKNGHIIEEFSKKEQEVLPRETALWISDMLKDNNARAPLFGANSLLYFGANTEVAAKTGTTNDYRDAWIVGYTPTIAVGAWAGNNDNQPMLQIAGLRISPLWRAFMDAALLKYPSTPFPNPEPLKDEELKPVLKGFWQGGKTYYVDAFSGLLASPNTPQELRDERVITEVHSILHWVEKDNPRGPIPPNPADDPQYPLWEGPVRAWAASQGMADQNETVIPQGTDTTRNPENMPRFSIISPSPSSTVPAGQKITVALNYQGTFALSKAEFYLNGMYIGKAEHAPFSFSFVPSDIPGIMDTNTLRVVVQDAARNSVESSVNFNVQR